MRKLACCFFFTFLINCLLFICYAQTFPPKIILNEKTPVSELGNLVSFLKDTTEKLTIQEIIKPENQAKFVKSTKQILNFELSEDWYWVRIDLENQSVKQSWLLEIAEAKIEFADLFYQDAQGKWQIIKNGYALPVKQKFKKHYFQVFPLDFPQKRAIFYLHTKGNLHPIPLKVISTEDFEQYHFQKNFMYGIYYGLLLFIILNNLIFGLLTQNRTFLLYVGMVFGYVLGSTLISGYFKLLTELNMLSMLPVAAFTISSFSILYLKRFLNISNQYLGGKILAVTSILILIGFFTTFFINPIQAILLAQISALAYQFITLFIVITSIRREKQFALYYLAGFMLLTVSVVLEITYANTGSPAYLYLTHIEWGYLFDVLILAFALNLRFFLERRQLRIAKDLAQKEALNQAIENAKLVAEQNQILEQKVQTRTQALQQVNQELEIREMKTQAQNEELKAIQEELRQNMEEFKALNEHLEQLVNERTIELQNTVEELSQQNQDLEQFSYIVSHNIRAPVARFLGLLSLYDRENLNTEFNRQLLGFLDQSAQNLDTIIRDLTNIITTRNRLDKIKESIDLQELSHSVIDALREDIIQSETQITLEFDDLPSINSVRAHLQSILYNLISNAIKYKSPKRKPIISIGTKVLPNQILIYVQDNGLGINLDKIDPYKIFGLYQRLHTHVEGKGLGLYLVKTEVESLKGKIEVESELDKGSTFKIYFPLEL